VLQLVKPVAMSVPSMTLPKLRVPHKVVAEAPLSDIGRTNCRGPHRVPIVLPPRANVRLPPLTPQPVQQQMQQVAMETPSRGLGLSQQRAASKDRERGEQAQYASLSARTRGRRITPRRKTPRDAGEFSQSTPPVSINVSAPRQEQGRPKSEGKRRMASLTRHRRGKQRLQRLQHIRRAEFESFPHDQQHALKLAFTSADATDRGSLDVLELPMACKALGLLPRNKSENAMFTNICEEVALPGDVDFYKFWSEAVPRIRSGFCNMRQQCFRQRFLEFDCDRSGYLSKNEALLAMERLLMPRLDLDLLDGLHAGFEALFPSAQDPSTGEIDLEHFEGLITQLEEQHQRRAADRELWIIAAENVSAEDVSSCRHELIGLHSSFMGVAAALGEAGCQSLNSQQMGQLLIELGLLPRCNDAVGVCLKECGFSENESFSFNNFLHIFSRRRLQEKHSASEDMMVLFETLDRDSSGELTLEETFEVIEKLGLSPASRDERDEIERLLFEVLGDSCHIVSFDHLQELALRILEHSRSVGRWQEMHMASELGFQKAELLELRAVFFNLGSTGAGTVDAQRLHDLVIRQCPELGNLSFKGCLKKAGVTSSPEALSFIDFLRIVRLTDKKPQPTQKTLRRW